MADSLTETVQVIIRLKPPLDLQQYQTETAVKVSNSETNTIVVETDSKKQFFSFDFIAGERCSQEEVYEYVGKPAVIDALKGYNCSIFAYGQTGAGKTYSILGTDLEDPYANSRGILLRLLQSLFDQLSAGDFAQTEVRCSYLQIYNEQIVDLVNIVTNSFRNNLTLNKDEIRPLPIREDCKKGVYVEGLQEQAIGTYLEAVNFVAKGLKNRHISATAMNSESSRSHTIFTMIIKTQKEQNGTFLERVSKMHVIDLAGSERQKQVNVKGDRLREGCSINKSLHCLGNVINSLVENIKKKKYVPYRDSKLTFFLKDSLGGNSKTKLLANVNPRKIYISDSISTLMFAKRAKILRVRVEANKNTNDSYDALRLEIKKLREELSQAKYLKNPIPTPFEGYSTPVMNQSNQYPNEMDTTRKIMFANNNNKICETSNNNVLGQSQIKNFDLLVASQLANYEPNVTKALNIFEKNESRYRQIIAINEERLSQMKPTTQNGNFSVSNSVRKNNLLPALIGRESVSFKTFFEEKKQLERQNASLQHLISNFPAFTRIFKDNLEYRQQNKQLQAKIIELEKAKLRAEEQMEKMKTNNIVLKQEMEHMDMEISHIRSSIAFEPVLLEGQDSKPVLKRTSTEIMETSLIIPQLDLNRTSIAEPRVTLTKRDDVRELIKRQNKMLEEYQKAIEQLSKSLKEQIQVSTEEYNKLMEMYENEKRQKNELRKMKRPEMSPDMEVLENQNEYLKLEVMNLQNDVSRLEETLFKLQVEVKTLSGENEQLTKQLQELHSKTVDEAILDEYSVLIEKLQNLKDCAETEQVDLEMEKEFNNSQFNELKSLLQKKNSENCALLEKNEVLIKKIHGYKQRLSHLEAQESAAEEQTTNSTDNNNEDAGTIKSAIYSQLLKEIESLNHQKTELLKDLEEQEVKNNEDRNKLQKASMKILSLTKQVTLLRNEQAEIQEENRQLLIRVDKAESAWKHLEQKNRVLQVDINKVKKSRDSITDRIRKEFGKSEAELIEEYKLLQIQNQLLRNNNSSSVTGQFGSPCSSQLVNGNHRSGLTSNQSAAAVKRPYSRQLSGDRKNKPVLSLIASPNNKFESFSREESQLATGMLTNRSGIVEGSSTTLQNSSVTLQLSNTVKLLPNTKSVHSNAQYSNVAVKQTTKKSSVGKNSSTGKSQKQSSVDNTGKMTRKTSTSALEQQKSAGNMLKPNMLKKNTGLASDMPKIPRSTTSSNQPTNK